MYVFDVFPELVTTGGSTRQRVGGRTAVAESKVSIRLSSKVAIENCLRMLEESDKRLASSGPVDPSGPYDWQFVLKEEFPDGQGVIHFGVAWYDEQFFDNKKNIFRDARHSKILQSIGVDDSQISVEHWVKVS